jgi:ABC-type transport system substrate-binding protein
VLGHGRPVLGDHPAGRVLPVDHRRARLGAGEHAPQRVAVLERPVLQAAVHQPLVGVVERQHVVAGVADAGRVLPELIQQELDATGDFQVTLNVEQESQYYGGSNATTPWLNAPVTITDWADRLPAQFENLIYGTGAVWNASHYVNSKLDGLATQYEATTAAAARQKIANQMASIEHNDVPVIIAAFQKNTLILSPKVQGNFIYGQNFDGGFDFRGISLK